MKILVVNCVVNIYPVFCCFCINHVLCFLMLWHLRPCWDWETALPRFSQFLDGKRLTCKGAFQIQPNQSRTHTQTPSLSGSHTSATVRLSSSTWARYQTTRCSCYVLNMLKVLKSSILNLLTRPHLFLPEKTMIKAPARVLSHSASLQMVPCVEPPGMACLLHFRTMSNKLN